ncbi:glucosylceramidase [Anaeramoeba flamelloides]|uniref:Glucosylceramidase n=1 Tax=Anaeramoeba flamelloides TaxID=1746091 RepID=A0AAV7YVH5_9EUKA|nr:glucosylceramidase [Anaeramoeba flamelloides]
MKTLLFFLLLLSLCFTNDIKVTQSAQYTGDRLTQKDEINFSNKAENNLKIQIDPTKTYQNITGFGGAFTEACAVNFLKLSSDLQNEIFSQYFHNIGYSLCRVHINSCDFSESSYSFDDTVNDYSLSSWSLNNGHDPKTLIPLIKKALTFNPNLQIYGSPWSPPAWMKGNNEMCHSSYPGLKADSRIHQAWALYFSKWISAYKQSGIPIWGLTIQNEPEFAAPWEACIYTPDQEADFLAQYLGPQIKHDHPEIKIMIYDHNKDHLETWANTIFSRSDASKFADGVAFHWYSGSQFENVKNVYDNWGDKFFLLATEACVCPATGFQDWNRGEQYGYDIIGDLNSGSVGWVDWNMCLNMQGGPNHLGNNCGSPVMVDADSNPQTITFTTPFYYMGQISKFLKPGSTILDTQIINGDENLIAVTGQTLDKKIVVVVQNQNDSERNFDLVYRNKIANISMPQHSITSFVFDA